MTTSLDDILKTINPTLVAAGVREAVLQLEDDEEEETEFYEVDLTEPQYLFYTNDSTYPLFVAGFGSGKSRTMCLSVITDLINFPGANIGAYSPTYDLLSLIIVPYITELLEEGGYEYSYNGSSHIFSVKGYGRIVCRSLDTPRRIVGYETFRAHCDELDTLPLDKARDVWNKVIARNRQKVFIRDDNGRKIPILDDEGKQTYDQNGKRAWLMHKNRVSAYTTPEGWNFAYHRWVEEKKDGDGYWYISASTHSNQHNLPPDYIDNLKKSYPPELIDAYIEGKFTNLTSGRVYRNFDRKLNSSNQVVKQNDVLHIGIDFNIDHGHAVIYVERHGEHGIEDHAVDEICDSYDTDETIKIINERYPNNACFIYPDASGTKRSSGSAGVNSKGEATLTDLWKLRQQPRFKIQVDNRNPSIKDSVLAMAARILDGAGKRHYFVNVKKCPKHVKTLEQQVWKEGVPDKSTGLDHSGDCGRYTMHKKYPAIKSKNGFVT